MEIKVSLELNREAKSLALPVSTQYKEELHDESKFSYAYSGRHDHGDLLPQSLNYYTSLVQTLEEAKKSTDAIVKEASNKYKAMHGEAKRMKVESD